MKKTLTLLLVVALAFTGCKKEVTGIENSAEHYALSEFMDSRAIDNDASRSNTISPRSNLKAIIRKVANTTDKYRLILKVDSIEIESKDDIILGGVPQFKMVALESFDKVEITAGLTLTDPINPDKETVFFTKESMTFTKQNENGFFVYASAPFGGPSGTTDEPNGFAYELVNISYTIRGFVGGVIGAEIQDLPSCFILPSGKAVEQNPEVEKTRGYLNNNDEFRKIEVTISGDPAQETESLKFVPDPKLKDPKDPNSFIQLPSILFAKTQFNQNLGIAKFETSGYIVWSGTDVRDGVNGRLYGNGKGGKITMEFMVEDFRYKVDHK